MAVMDVDALRQIDHRWRTAELGITSEEVGKVMRQLPAIIDALERAETARQDGFDEAMARDVQTWEAAERELEAMTADRDCWQERAERVESAATPLATVCESWRCSECGGPMRNHWPECTHCDSCKGGHPAVRCGACGFCLLAAALAAAPGEEGDGG